MSKIERARTFHRAATVAILLLSLYACTVGPEFALQKTDVPRDWVDTSKTQGATQAQPSIVTAAPVEADAWWTNFRDPVLTSLIGRAAAANLDIRAAALRIAEARAQRGVAGAGQWPSLSGNASYMNQRFSQKTAQGSAASLSYPDPYDQFQIGFDASWEPDLFGGVRRSVEATDADAQASVEDANDALVSLESEIARAYIDLRSAQAHRAITQDNLGTQHQIESLTRQKMRAGLGNELDVSNAAAQTTATEAQLPLFNRQIDTDINQLSALLAREPGALHTELQGVKAVPPAPPVVPIGLPADLIRRRPDIRAAEARLHAATARVGVAVADMFPRITLDASFGTEAERFPDLAAWASRFINIGPSLQIPIFEGGKLRATVRLQNIHEKEAAVAYAEAVLNALHEVEDALIAYNTEQSRRVSLQATLAHNRDALALARQRYEGGLTMFLDVLDAERTMQETELSLADSTAAVSTYLVALYKALGGGWEGQDVALLTKAQRVIEP